MLVEHADGPTANDPGDADSGGNRLQNSPDVVDAVPVGPDRFRLDLRVDSAPGNATYPLRVDAFRGRGADLLEHLAQRTITLAEAQTVVSIELPLSALADGVVQLLATDQFLFPVSVQPRTYLLAGATVVVTTLVTAAPSPAKTKEGGVGLFLPPYQTPTQGSPSSLGVPRRVPSS